MNKLNQRVEVLEGSIKPQPSIFLQKAAELLTDKELASGKRYLELAIAGKEGEATPEQRSASQRFWQLEAELRAASVSNG